MLRDPNLIPLSHQHHNALAMCVLTRRSLAQDTSAGNIVRLAQRIADRYELELVNHFEIEEQILFPAVELNLGKLPLVNQLIGQHRELASLISRLRSAPDVPMLEGLCELLTNHIRLEERNLFPMIQLRLPEVVLLELGKAIDAKVVRICL